MRTDEQRWLLVRTFYQSFRSFSALYEQYEARVKAFAQRYGVDRTKLKLPPDELQSLIDSQALLALRDGELALLRQIAHQLFRGAYVPDPFDSHVTNIYHEVSILKEEHRTIGDASMRLDRAEYDRYYREVNVYYPRRLRHVRNLYGKARKRLEQLLPTMGRTKVIVRSVYLFGDRLVRGVYEGGIEELYKHMYPNGGAVTGYTLVADSFLDGGFWEEAAEAYRKVVDTLDLRIEAAAGDDPKKANARKTLTTQKANVERRLARALEKV